MKTSELFESVRSESGDDVSLSLNAFYDDSLITNIDYRPMLKKKESDEFREQRYRARRAASDNPQLDAAMEAWEDKISLLGKETEQEILQLVVAYKNMVYGLITLAHQKIQEDWNNNVMSKVPGEPEATNGGSNGPQNT